MASPVIVERVKELILPILKEEGVELWDVQWTNDLGRRVLRIMIEKNPGPLTLGDCSRVSHSIEDLLEVKEVIPIAYDLEVSSPGLDRPLRTFDQFKKYEGSVVSVKTEAPIDGRRNYKGSLKKVEDESITVEVDRKDFVIPLAKIQKANVEFTS